MAFRTIARQHTKMLSAGQNFAFTPVERIRDRLMRLTRPCPPVVRGPLHTSVNLPALRFLTALRRSVSYTGLSCAFDPFSTLCACVHFSCVASPSGLSTHCGSDSFLLLDRSSFILSFKPWPDTAAAVFRLFLLFCWQADGFERLDITNPSTPVPLLALAHRQPTVLQKPRRVERPNHVVSPSCLIALIHYACYYAHAAVKIPCIKDPLYRPATAFLQLASPSSGVSPPNQTLHPFSHRLFLSNPPLFAHFAR